MNAEPRHPSCRIMAGDVLDCLGRLPSDSVNCVVTSPPYWGLRDYGAEGQIGLEPTLAEWVEKMRAVFAEVRRVLRGDGTCWVNLGDAYATAGGAGVQGKNGARAGRRETSFRGALAMRNETRNHDSGLKPKDLMGQPWRVAFALQDDGWFLRSDIIWSKPNPMPESVTDRPTKAHEYLFLMTKSARYFYDAEAVRESAKYGRRQMSGYFQSVAQEGRRRATGTTGGKSDNPSAGRNARTVWTMATQPCSEAHFATFPRALPERCIRAGCPEGGTVLEPFLGSGTTAIVAAQLGRSCIGIELNPTYREMAERRIRNEVGLLTSIETEESKP